MGRGGDTRSSSSAAAAKLKALGLIRGGQLSTARPQKLQFKLFFPRKPYHGAEYTAAKGKEGLYNFVGLVLGHHGTTIQRLQRSSGAKIELHSKGGNLNGDHPPLDDTSLHALIQAESKAQLEKAVQLLLDTLRPTNTTHKPFPIVAGGSAVLQPVPVPGHKAQEEEEEPLPAAVAGEGVGEPAAAGSPAQQAAALAPNAWQERLRSRQQQQGQECEQGPMDACTAAGAGAGVQQEQEAQEAAQAGGVCGAGTPEPRSSGAGESVLAAWLSGGSDLGSSGSQDAGSPSNSAGRGCCCYAALGSPEHSLSSADCSGESEELPEPEALAPGLAPPAAAPAQEPRQWSLWGSDSAPSLFDQLQSVVQEQQLQLSPGAALAPLAPAPPQQPLPGPQGAAPAPECCYFQEKEDVPQGGLPTALPFPGSPSWVQLRPMQQLALGPGAGSVPIDTPEWALWPGASEAL